MNVWMLLLGSIAYLHTGIKAEKTESCMQDGAIRLRGERRNETCGFTTGRVEVCESSQWKRICDSEWSVADARVACRDLGYLSIGVVNLLIEQSGSMIADSSSQVPTCSGSEEQIMDCPFIEADDTTINNCVSIAGIQCYLNESSLALCGGISIVTTQPTLTETQPATTIATTTAPNTPSTAPDTPTTPSIVIETSEPSETSQNATMSSVSDPSQTKSQLKSYHYVIIAFAAVILILIVVISICLTVFCVRNSREFKEVPNDVSPVTRNSESSKEALVNKYQNTEHIQVPDYARNIQQCQGNPNSCNLDKNPAYEIITTTTHPVRNEVTEVREKTTPIAFATEESAVISQLCPPQYEPQAGDTTSKESDDCVHTYDDIIIPRIIQTEV